MMPQPIIPHEAEAEVQEPAGTPPPAVAALPPAPPAPSSTGGSAAPGRKIKKPKKRNKDSSGKDEGARKKQRKPNRSRSSSDGLSAAQQAVQEQMRRALEEDKYSAVGSIVQTESDDDDMMYNYRGFTVRLDKPALQQAIRKHNLLERLGVGAPVGTPEEADDEEEVVVEREPPREARREKPKKMKRKEQGEAKSAPTTSKDPLSLDAADDDMDRDGSSIFGATAGSSNSIWVECDKCKKWRRLRGAVDEKKLPSKWYCSMNKNDPDRARCSAPEEEYEAPATPESAADARARKHLRIWVRRMQCNEAYEARQPTLTRGKKRAVTSSSKDPYEWVRCCNPSCGKWRAVLRIMDSKTNVIDRTVNGEWYCVMNNWDEMVASCAAPQQNLPAVGCPPWVMQDE